MKLQLNLEPISTGETVIVGVSGGRDSMSLLHALKAQRPDLTIIPAHINHGLRPCAVYDAEFTLGMSKRWGMDCQINKPRPPKEGNIEEWGRNKRYAFFEKLRKKHKAQWILTAHHQNDDFESMMLSFLRGTRVKGLSGMATQRQNIFRPLLETSRSEIEAYVEHHQIRYVDDPTNEDMKYSRNFLRKKIIPTLNHLYPGLASRWQKQKNYWLELQEMLEIEAERFLDQHLDPEKGLNREAYKTLPLPLRSTVLELWFKESTGKRISDSASIHRWDTAIRTFNSRKKTEWDAGKFLVMAKKRAQLK
jgi:tRNA(Ile)-lysidine synthase